VFKEIGEEGTQLENEIDRIRKKYEMRIMGPNCLGFVRPVLGLKATFLKGDPPPGNIAFWGLQHTAFRVARLMAC
jgi:acetyltransferase